MPRSPARAPPSSLPRRPRRSASPPTSLRRLEQDPNDHQTRFDLAIALNVARRPRRRRRAAPRDRPPQPRLERGGGAQAARPVLRGLGPQGSRDGAGSAGACRHCSSLRRIEAAKAARRIAIARDGRQSDAIRLPADIPGRIPVFPLSGALLLPSGQMPLNIFEPRYIAMVDGALMSGDRVIGMIQPALDERRKRAGRGSAGSAAWGGSRSSPKPATGATSSRSGISRFRVVEEIAAGTPFRQCRVSVEAFADLTVPRAARTRSTAPRAARLPRFSRRERDRGRLGERRTAPPMPGSSPRCP